MALWNETYKYLKVSCLLILGASNPISCMELKETKKEWRLLQEKSIPKCLNALCAGSTVKKEQVFKVLHEDGGPTCTNYRRLTIVDALKQDAREKTNQDIQLPLHTAFTECGVQSAYGFCNGTVEITTIERSKKLEELITIHQYSLKAYDEPVIALQFSSDGWYMATLACKSLKLWERQRRMDTMMEQTKKNVPIIKLDSYKERSCCAIL